MTETRTITATLRDGNECDAVVSLTFRHKDAYRATEFEEGEPERIVLDIEKIESNGESIESSIGSEEMDRIYKRLEAEILADWRAGMYV